MARPAAAPSATILVVDDDALLRELVHDVLKPHYKVITASDGDEALALLRKTPVDVIITDQMMPRMSGTKLLEQSLAINPRIVKIILSAYTDTADILSAINVCRINHFMVKPVDVNKLLEVVARALELVPAAAKYD